MVVVVVLGVVVVVVVVVLGVVVVNTIFVNRCCVGAIFILVFVDNLVVFQPSKIVNSSSDKCRNSYLATYYTRLLSTEQYVLAKGRQIVGNVLTRAWQE